MRNRVHPAVGHVTEATDIWYGRRRSAAEDGARGRTSYVLPSIRWREVSIPRRVVRSHADDLRPAPCIASRLASFSGGASPHYTTLRAGLYHRAQSAESIDATRRLSVHVG